MSELTTPVGVCVFPPPPQNAARTAAYPNYVHEILGHTGLCYFKLSHEELAVRSAECGVLVTVGEYALGEAASKTLSAWVHGGGCWISIAGVCGVPELFGVEVEKPQYTGWGISVATLGEGYARVTDHVVCADASAPVHFFNGIPVRTTVGKMIAAVLDNHHRPTSRAAIVENAVGSGRTILIAPDLTGTVVRIQQGIGVTRDGVSAPDATGPIMDDVLKSGDGAVLDWHFDRRPVPSVPGLSGYLDPVADTWREVLLRAIFYMAQTRKLSIPLLWFYPRNLPAIAHMSHDTDGNEPEKADTLLSVLEQGGIKSTWCVILPGYDEGRMRRIADAGHELATHYDAMTPGLEWSETQFDRQHRELTAMFRGARPVSNKNHYLRWEGDCELLDWCLARGIQIDQSKGASKPGEVGYNFGTCHPYFLVRMNGETIDVLEMMTPVQDLEVFAPRAVFESLLAAALKRYGIVHLLFHPAHTQKPEVADSLLDSIAKARAAGLEWWTAREINSWERARRGVNWSGFSQGKESASVTVRADRELPDATILWLRPAGESGGIGRWGFSFDAQQKTLQPGIEITVSSDRSN